jgi:uncharacterized protein (TIGR02246 family)
MKPENMQAAADALDQKFVEAFNAGDADALMDTYWNSPDLVSFPPDGMGGQGWDQTKAAAVSMFAGLKGAKLEITTHHNDVHGEVVLGWGMFTLTLPDSAGTQIHGRFSDVKTEKDGKWVYIMDHASVPLPPPPSE